MKLSAPKNVTWVIAVVLGLIGILDNQGILSIGGSDFLFVALGFVLLALATWFKGL